MSIGRIESVLRTRRMQLLAGSLEGERAIDRLQQSREEVDEGKKGVDSDNR